MRDYIQKVLQTPLNRGFGGVIRWVGLCGGLFVVEEDACSSQVTPTSRNFLLRCIMNILTY
jgi:hypothetical protein